MNIMRKYMEVYIFLGKIQALFLHFCFIIFVWQQKRVMCFSCAALFVRRAFLFKIFAFC